LLVAEVAAAQDLPDLGGPKAVVVAQWSINQVLKLTRENFYQ
jgi:hypothetical protein